MTTSNSGQYYSGTSGLVLPVKNKSFYPEAFQEKSRLTYYGSLFNSIEINSSFYKLPRLVTLQKWTHEVPEGFRFTVKLLKDITHAKDLLFDEGLLKTFLEAIHIPDDNKGCLLIQFPPGLKRSAIRQLQHLLQVISQDQLSAHWNLNVEFRDASWYREETFELIAQYRCGLVIHDKTGSAAPMEDPGTDFVYLRFHGPQGNYRGSYDDAFLHEYATYIREWIDSGRDVYVYFNNTMGDAIRNLMTLNDYVGAG